MSNQTPEAELDTRFSAGNAEPTQWTEAVGVLEQAETFWLSTVRPDGRPHVTTLLALWLDDALHFCTGTAERKAHNLARNPRCALTTGHNSLDRGLDLVVEGVACRVEDDARLERIADAYEAKYSDAWHFDVRDGAFFGEGGEALVFKVAPVKVLGFRKGEFSQTRWRFPVARQGR